MAIVLGRPDLGRGHARTRRRLAAAVALAALLLPIVAPATQARASGGYAFGQSTGLRHKVVGRAHIPSVAALAQAQAPRGGHPAAHPMLKADWGRKGAAQLVKPAVPAAPAIVTTPDVAALTSFAGMGEAESGGWTPADPWVAASGSYLVQVVNNEVRVSNRAGGELLSVANEVFFNVPPGHAATDSRIIWDAAHNRWVGETVWFVNDFSDNGFTLAISDGPDPTASWTLLTIGYGNTLPDFPSLASSNDKIVVADDLFDSLGGFLSSDINTITWASVLAGGTLTYNYCDDSGWGHPRAAQVLSASNDIHLIMEATDGSGDQWYFRIVGAGICTSPTFQVIDGLDLAGMGVPPIQAPPAPRQTGSDTIANATDGRATDAVWQNGHLWWVSTVPFSYDAGATSNDAVEIYGVDTLSSGPPAIHHLQLVTPGDGIDAYLGGIGLTRSGTPIIVYSQSSNTDPVALYANRIDPSVTLGTPLLLDTSEGAAANERWGDYAGVAMDPTGTGAVWATDMLAAADGTWRTRVTRLIVDTDVPSTPAAPTGAIYSPTSLTTAPKITLAWGGATDASSGSVTYRLEQSVDGGGYALVGLFGTTATIRSLYLGHAYQYRVAAVDPLGKVGAFAIGPALHPGLAQSPSTKTGTWGTQTSPNFTGGGTWYASTAGATASYTNTGLRSIAIVATKATSRGSFKVYVDGVLKATVSCYATTTAFRQVVYQFAWATPGTHTIKLVIVGTAGHPRVDVDGFLVLK